MKSNWHNYQISGYSKWFLEVEEIFKDNLQSMLDHTFGLNQHITTNSLNFWTNLYSVEQWVTESLWSTNVGIRVSQWNEAAFWVKANDVQWCLNRETGVGFSRNFSKRYCMVWCCCIQNTRPVLFRRKSCNDYNLSPEFADALKILTWWITTTAERKEWIMVPAKWGNHPGINWLL